MRSRRFWIRIPIAIFVALFLAIAAGEARAQQEGDFAPANAEKTLGRLRWVCMIGALCPLSSDSYKTLKQAIAGDRNAQYLWGLTLLTGNGAPSDRPAGMQWIVLAAEQGAPDAAIFLADKQKNGEAIEIDEDKVATALRKQVDAGDVESMRALGPMYIRGRGVARDVNAGIALLRRAAERGSVKAEQDLSDVYLYGAPGVPKNRAEALKWLALSAGHGNIDAMVDVGYMSLTTPIDDDVMKAATGNPRDLIDAVKRRDNTPFKSDLAQGYCWLARAALMDSAQAQEKLSLMFAYGEHDDRGEVLATDLIEADFWFRLAARNPYHDNSQIRGGIEPKMTSAQLNEAKRRGGEWHARTLPEMKATTITLPAAISGPAPRTCPAMA